MTIELSKEARSEAIASNERYFQRHAKQGRCRNGVTIPRRRALPRTPITARSAPPNCRF